MIITPVWHIQSLEGQGTDKLNEDSIEAGIFNFKIGDIFGYMDLSGRLKYLDRIDYQIAVADDKFINYSNLPNTFVIQNLEGEYISSFWTNGYPKYSGNRLFMVKNDTTGISEINEQGEALWSCEFTSLITSMCITEQYVLIGLLDGRLKLLNEQGEPVYEVAPGGSRIQVIYGCCINSDGTAITGISGLYPQRFFYIKGPDFNNSSVDFTDLDSDFRREMLITFGDSEKYVFFEGAGKLNVFDIGQNKLKEVQAKGSVKGISEFETMGIISVLSESGEGTELQVVRLDDKVIYSEMIPGKDVFMKNVSDSLLIGYLMRNENGISTTHLLRYDLTEM